MDDKELVISVIIPTYNGAHKIVNALESIEKQSVAPDEVIVVVDGSTDNTIDILKSKKYNFKSFKIIEQTNQGRAKVRNNGVKETIGNILVFCDDDMIVPKSWIEAHKNHHINYPNSICVGELKGLNIDEQTDFYKFKMWLHYKWTANIEMSSNDIVLLKEPYITANNFSINKNIFHRLSGFDGRLTDGEVFDLANRAKIDGIKIYHNKKAFSYNNDEDNITCKTMIKRLRQYDAAYHLLSQLKPDMYKPKQVKKISLLKKMTFSLFCYKFWIDTIDNKFWVFLPQTIRFKLYDIIVTANATIFPNRLKLN